MKSTPTMSNRLLMGSIVALIIVVTPLVFYSYLCFPDVKIWKTLFFTYDSHFYESVQTFVWVFLQKFIFFYLMIIFYFNCKEWWRNAILSPIAMLLYQLIMLINDEVKLKDEGSIEISTILILVIGICITMVILRNKLSFYSKTLDLKSEIDLKIKEIQTELNG